MIRQPNGQSRSWWRCDCDCGAFVDVCAGLLLDGQTKSCGCLQRERSAQAATRHGGSRAPEYAVWSSMKARCSNPNQISYPRYGGLGVRVCPEWIASYEAFIADVGLRPSDDHSIDRIDPAGNYEPGNVRWATQIEQARNKKTTRMTSEAAAAIRARFIPRRRGGGGNCAALAAEFGVSVDTIRKIANGATWSEES